MKQKKSNWIENSIAEIEIDKKTSNYLQASKRRIKEKPQQRYGKNTGEIILKYLVII